MILIRYNGRNAFATQAPDNLTPLIEKPYRTFRRFVVATFLGLATFISSVLEPNSHKLRIAIAILTVHN